MIDRFEKFSYYLAELSYYWHKIATEAMEEYGLKGPYAVYFTVLRRYDAGLTAGQLSELCARDKADVSRAVALLEKKALIRKECDGGAYRAKIVLTAAGAALADDISCKANAAVEQGGRGLTDSQREAMYTALEVITTNLRTVSREGLTIAKNEKEKTHD